MFRMIVLELIVFSIVGGYVYAHDAPTGWSYPFNCCAGYDCRDVPEEAIGTTRTGYVIRRTGEVVGYHDKRLKDSPDGTYHWCSEQGRDDTKTICLFVPPLGY